jgi:hypothetical protein
MDVVRKGDMIEEMRNTHDLVAREPQSNQMGDPGKDGLVVSKLICKKI